MPVQRKNRLGQKEWYGRVKIPGRKNPKEKKCKNKKEATAWELSQQKLIESLPHDPKTNCGDWADTYISHCKAKGEVDVEQKELAFKRFFDVFSPLSDPAKLKPVDFLKVLDRIAVSISGNRANKTKGYYRTAYKWGITFMDLPQPNPLDSIQRYKAEKQALHVPTEGDFWKVFDVASEKHQTMLACYLYTGARKDEVLRLQLKDINLFNKSIRLWTRKRKCGWEFDWLPMVRPLQDTLENWIKSQGITSPDAYLFTNPSDGKRLKSMRYFLKRLSERAKVTPFSFKGVRHLTAISLYKEGCAVADIQQLLRHKNPTTTENYLRSLGIMQPSRTVLESFAAKRQEVHQGKVVDLKKVSQSSES